MPAMSPQDFGKGGLSGGNASNAWKNDVSVAHEGDVRVFQHIL